MNKAYTIFGTVLCIVFFYASRAGFIFFDFGSSAGHIKPAGPGIHHK